MGNRSFREIHRDLEPKKEAANSAIVAAKDLITEVIEASLQGVAVTADKIPPIDAALSDAYDAFYESQEVLDEYNEAIHLLKQNKKFMKENASAMEGFEQLASTYERVNAAFEDIIGQLETQFVKLKLQAGMSPEDSERSDCRKRNKSKKSDKKKDKSKKCAPGCIIM